jgi:hypothetical protein
MQATTIESAHSRIAGRRCVTQAKNPSRRVQGCLICQTLARFGDQRHSCLLSEAAIGDSPQAAPCVPPGPDIAAHPTDDVRTNRSVSLAALLLRQSHVLRREQALGYLSSWRIRCLLKVGVWRVAHRGIYVGGDGVLDERQRRWVAVLACRGHLAGPSALRVFGLAGHRDRLIHVLVPARARDTDPPPGVIVHRTSILPEPDRTTLEGLPCTTAARAVVDAVQWAHSDEHAYRLVTSCLDQLAEAAVQPPRPGRTRPVPRRLLRRVRRAHRDRRRSPQRPCGVVGRGAPPQRRSIIGESMLHFPAWAVRRHPGQVAGQLRAALIAAGWPSP